MTRKKYMDPEEMKAIEAFNQEMNASLGEGNDRENQEEQAYIPRKVIEKAERQLMNNKKQN